MSNERMKVPKELKVSIRDFIANYVQGPTYRGKCKLTHQCLTEYLQKCGCRIPKRVAFNSIKEEDLYLAKVVFVYDVTNQVIPYKNPLYKTPEEIFENLESTTEKELAKRREMIIRKEFRDAILDMLREKREQLTREQALFYEQCAKNMKGYSRLPISVHQNQNHIKIYSKGRGKR